MYKYIYSHFLLAISYYFSLLFSSFPFDIIFWLQVIKFVASTIVSKLTFLKAILFYRFSLRFWSWFSFREFNYNVSPDTTHTSRGHFIISHNIQISFPLDVWVFLTHVQTLLHSLISVISSAVFSFASCLAPRVLNFIVETNELASSRSSSRRWSGYPFWLPISQARL